jgi:hypothetical protein
LARQSLSRHRRWYAVSRPDHPLRARLSVADAGPAEAIALPLVAGLTRCTPSRRDLACALERPEERATNRGIGVGIASAADRLNQSILNQCSRREVVERILERDHDPALLLWKLPGPFQVLHSSGKSARHRPLVGHDSSRRPPYSLRAPEFQSGVQCIVETE